MDAPVNRGARIGLWIVLGLGAAIAAPSACLFPSYTFGEPEPSGSGGSTASSGPTTGTGGMTTSSSTSTGGGGATSSSSSSTGGMTEDCGNGVDDNADGKIDCADPGCAASHGCVTSVPGGWTGHYVIYEGSAANDPGCPPEFPGEFYTGNGGLVVPAHSCSACMCGNPTGQACSVAKLVVSNSTCLQQTMAPSCGAPLTIVADGSCYGPNGFTGGDNTCSTPVMMMCPLGSQPCNVGVTVDPATVTGGSCAATPQVPNVPPTSWTSFVRACQQTTPGGGCNAGQACLSKPASPYLTSVCISQPGVQACPATYPNQHIYYDSAVTDTRDCSACSCGNPTGGTCSPTISIYKDLGVNTCNSLVDTIAAGACKDIAGNPAVVGRKANNIAVSGGTCAVSGGVATGTATPQNPVTFCCK